jgi:uncharacterized protein
VIALPVTAGVAGLLAVLMVPLSMQVSLRRASIGKRNGNIAAAVFGDAGDDGLRNAIRAFGNFIEYVPMIVLLLALAELRGAPQALLAWTGGAFVAARLVHAVAMTFRPHFPAPRGAAMLVTHGATLLIGGWLLLNA